MNNALMIVPTIDERPVSISTESGKKKQEALTVAKKVTQVTNKQELQTSVNTLQTLKSLLNDADAACELLKRPFYTIYKKILSLTDEYKLEIQNECLRIKRLNDAFAAEEQRRADAENKRLEDERKAAEKKAADALAEQERINNLSRPSPKKEIAAETKVQAAVAEVKQLEAKAPAAPMKVAGYSAKKVVRYEITDAAALYAVRPEFFNLVEKKSVINAAITKDTKLPGLKVWEAIDTGVRT